MSVVSGVVRVDRPYIRVVVEGQAWIGVIAAWGGLLGAISRAVQEYDPY